MGEVRTIRVNVRRAKEMKNDHKRKQQWGKGIDSWGLGFTPVPHCLSSLLLFLNCLAFFSRPGLLASLLSWHGGKTKWIQHAPFFNVKQHCKKTLGTDVSSFYVKSTHTPLLFATALFFLEYPCRPVTLPLEPSMTNTFNIALYNWLPPFVVPLFNQGLHTLETKSKRKKKTKTQNPKKTRFFFLSFPFYFFHHLTHLPFHENSTMCTSTADRDRPTLWGRCWRRSK